jgi:hypothetical protein
MDWTAVSPEAQKQKSLICFIRFYITVAFKSEQLRKYFPKSYSPKQMQDTIIKLLEQWQRKRQRDQER